MVNKHLIWALSIILIFIIMCGTLIWINNNAWVVRFEMDNNTKAAVESIEWEALYYNIDDNKTIYIKENDTFIEVEVIK